MASYDPNVFQDAPIQMGVYLTPYIPGQEALPTVPLQILTTAFVNGLLRVTFNQSVFASSAISDPANYVITGPTKVSVLTATPENVLNPTYVDLGLSEQRIGVGYTVTVTRIIGTLE